MGGEDVLLGGKAIYRLRTKRVVMHSLPSVPQKCIVKHSGFSDIRFGLDTLVKSFWIN